MKNLVTAALAAATLTLAVPAFAGEPTAPTAPMTPDQTARDTDKADDLKVELNLDDATAQRVQTIMTSAREQQQTLRTQFKTSVDDLRRAREAGEPKTMNAALDRLRGLHNRLKDLETETVDRVLANLTLQQQADFMLYMVDKRNDRLLSDDQA